jgi:hypothetical protein
MSADAPIGVLGGDWAGSAVIEGIQRRLPHEDVVYLADEAWAPYARRPGAATRDRVMRLAADLVEQHGCKLVLLASLQASLDGLDAARARVAPVPVVGVDAGAVLARAAALAGSGGVEVAVGPGCVRAEQLRRALRNRGDRSLPHAPGDGPGEAVVALLCAHTSAAPPAGVTAVNGLDLAAGSACATLRGMGATARRRRPGRRILVSSRPAG